MFRNARSAIVNDLISVVLKFAGKAGNSKLAAARGWPSGNARVMQLGRHRKLKPFVLEVRILSRVPSGAVRKMAKRLRLKRDV